MNMGPMAGHPFPLVMTPDPFSSTVCLGAKRHAHLLVLGWRRMTVIVIGIVTVMVVVIVIVDGHGAR